MNCPYYVNTKGACISPGNPSTKSGTVQDKGAYDMKRCKSDKHSDCPHFRNAQGNVGTSKSNYCPHCGKPL